jgi:multiple antibiotic resistance protein
MAGLTDFLSSVMLLYVLVDPIGNIPLFIAITSRMEREQRRRTLELSVLVAAGILAAFSLFGTELLRVFGISMGDFVIACGLVLSAFSLYYLLRPYEQRVVSDGLEVAVVPLAVPFLAGPASISYVVLLSGSAGPLFTLLVVAAVSALTLATLAASEPLLRILGVIGLRVIEKIILLLCVALGVSLLRRGFEQWLRAGS